MRHYFSCLALGRHSNGGAVGTFRPLCPIPGHPGGMCRAASPGLLPASACTVQRVPARLSGAIAVAIDLSAIAAPADDHLAAAPPAHKQTARPWTGPPVIIAAAA